MSLPECNLKYFLSVKPNIFENEELREPQRIAYQKVAVHFLKDNKKTDAIVILPTGVGKTGLMGLLPYGISSGRVLIITPQLVIKDSVIGSLDPEYPQNFWLNQKVFDRKEDLPCLIEYEGKDTKDEFLKAANIVVLNIQKLQNRLSSTLLKRVSPEFFDMIIIDEAHHSTAITWIDTLQYFSKAKVIKLTGTPFRTDGERIVGEICYEYKLSAAMAHGFVKSLENFTYIPDELYFSIDNDDTKLYTYQQLLELGIKDEDWISRTVAYSIECSEKIVDKSIEKLQEKLDNDNKIPHKIIAVACSIKHAEQIKVLYEHKGIRATIIHSDLDKKIKEAALNDVENNRVQAIINVAMLGEGYDHPYLSVAAILRPFRSLLPYAQFIGRVLRAIPLKDNPKAVDNIAQIVSHQHLFLDKLWIYYKKEIQESQTIKYLSSLNLDPNLGQEDVEPTKVIDKDIGNASENGIGKLIGDAYLTTELIKQRDEEAQADLEKIQEIQKILNVSVEDARRFIEQAKGLSNPILRPDLYFKQKKSNIDAQINENLIPTLLNDYGLVKEQDDLKNHRIFQDRNNSWIKNNFHDNAAILAVYINNLLKNMIGRKREEWTIDDYELADKKLDQIEEFLRSELINFK